MQHPIADSPTVRASIEAVLRDGTWCDYSGWAVEQLKAQLAARFSQPFVQLCSSGTIATEIALRGLQVGPEHEVILAGYDFHGNFRAIEAVGSRPVLVDIQDRSWIIDIDKIEGACSVATKAIVVSHLHGQNVSMRKLMELSRRLNLVVVEDSCQAPGATIDGKPAGSWGDCSTLSFGGSKLLTSGRGGAVLSRDPRVAQRISNYCERGNDAFALSQLQAAALLPQLNELNEWNRRRNEVVAKLSGRFLAQYPWLTYYDSPQVDPTAFYKWPLLLKNFADRESSERFRDFAIQSLNESGIPTGPGFHGFHRRTTKRCRVSSSLANAIVASERTVLIQHHALLLNDIAEKLEQAFAKIDNFWNEHFSNK